MECKLCRREVRAKDGSLCDYHQDARNSLRRAYEAWNIAYSGISWREYLNKVKALEDTGAWIKDVISLEDENAD